MTDEQFKVLLDGAGIAGGEELHRLSGLLTAVAGLEDNPTAEQIAEVRNWATKIAQDLINHKRKNEK